MILYRVTHEDITPTTFNDLDTCEAWVADIVDSMAEGLGADVWKEIYQEFEIQEIQV